MVRVRSRSGELSHDALIFRSFPLGSISVVVTRGTYCLLAGVRFSRRRPRSTKSHANSNAPLDHRYAGESIYRSGDEATVHRDGKLL
jgi:hypothetical protein